jgi:hypothetical protein
MSFHVMSFNAMHHLFKVISLMSFHLIQVIHVISFNVISCHFISFHVISCHFMSFHVIQIIYVISCHFMSFHVSLDFSDQLSIKLGVGGSNMSLRSISTAVQNASVQKSAVQLRSGTYNQFECWRLYCLLVFAPLEQNSAGTSVFVGSDGKTYFSPLANPGGT